MTMKFCPLASGSNGNSVFVGTEHTKILIDAGISGRKIKESLEEIKVSLEEIDALFITHEHVDHIKGAGVISRKYNIPIYATPGTWASMCEEIGKIGRNNIRYVYGGEICVCNDIQLYPFEIPHDAAEPVGYSIVADGCKATVATDLGHVTETVKENIYGSDILLLEANHDVEMLKRGSYPWPLKKRILGDLGHISNETAGNLLSEIMTSRLKYVFLGHLSQENNTPHMAYETVEDILKKNRIKPGVHVNLDMASRYSVSRAITL